MIRTVQTRSRSVSDRATAALLRETFLEPAVADDPLVIDLTEIEQMAVEAADELVAKFVVRIRTLRAGAVVFVRLCSDDVLSAVHAALRDRRQAAWGVDTRKPEVWVLLGAIDGAELEALRAFSGGNHQAPGLDALVTAGLLVQAGGGYAPPLLPAEDLIEEPVPA